jgi:hypothetical protein
MALLALLVCSVGLQPEKVVVVVVLETVVFVVAVVAVVAAHTGVAVGALVKGLLLILVMVAPEPVAQFVSSGPAQPVHSHQQTLATFN